ncbi:hypothetical protein BGLA2_460030 [Burkholderia gladioli]|nr:hypothetical protein BGLA2_460030 [Burkholderia gladioli]
MSHETTPADHCNFNSVLCLHEKGTSGDLITRHERRSRQSRLYLHASGRSSSAAGPSG